MVLGQDNPFRPGLLHQISVGTIHILDKPLQHQHSKSSTFCIRSPAELLARQRQCVLEARSPHQAKSTVEFPCFALHFLVAAGGPNKKLSRMSPKLSLFVTMESDSSDPPPKRKPIAKRSWSKKAKQQGGDKCGKASATAQRDEEDEEEDEERA